jgi:hypothetical protein
MACSRLDLVLIVHLCAVLVMGVSFHETEWGLPCSEQCQQTGLGNHSAVLTQTATSPGQSPL